MHYYRSICSQKYIVYINNIITYILIVQLIAWATLGGEWAGSSQQSVHIKSELKNTGMSTTRIYKVDDEGVSPAQSGLGPSYLHSDGDLIPK